MQLHMIVDVSNNGNCCQLYLLPMPVAKSLSNVQLVLLCQLCGELPDAAIRDAPQPITRHATNAACICDSPRRSDESQEAASSIDSTCILQWTCLQSGQPDLTDLRLMFVSLSNMPAGVNSSIMCWQLTLAGGWVGPFREVYTSVQPSSYMQLRVCLGAEVGLATDLMSKTGEISE